MTKLIGGPADGVELGKLEGRHVYVPLGPGHFNWSNFSYAIYRRGHYSGRWMFVGVKGVNQ